MLWGGLLRIYGVGAALDNRYDGESFNVFEIATIGCDQWKLPLPGRRGNPGV